MPPRRDLSTFNTVTGQAVEQSSTNFTEGLVKLGNQIIETSQEAKINENISRAQLGLAEMDNDFRRRAQTDPFNQEILDEYKTNRKEFLSTLGDEISPLFRQEWNKSAANLTNQSDLSNQAWGFKQARVNTIQSVNTSIANNMALAAEAGRDYAVNATTDIEAMFQFKPAKEAITRSASKILGGTELTGFLDTFEEDYLKSFISGVAEQNPQKALQLLNNERVKKSISDSETYSKFKSAVEARALQKKEIEENTIVLKQLKNKDGLLSRSSLSQPISYAELQTEFEKNNFPEGVQNFFLEANGYKRLGAELTDEQKENMRLDVLDAVASVAGSENIKTEDIQKMQNVIYDAMSKKALNRGEGTDIINQLLEPLIEQKQESLDAYGDNTLFFFDKIGFDALEDYYSDEVEVGLPDDKTLQPAVQRINNSRKLALYDAYYNELKREAGIRGKTVAGIKDLDSSERRGIYTTAFDNAKQVFAETAFPKIRSLGGLPNSIVTKDGKTISLKSGESTAKANVRIQDVRSVVETDKNGNRARVFYKGPVKVRAEILGPDNSVIQKVMFDANGKAVLDAGN